MTFTQGEHLTAAKMNQLAQIAANAANPTMNRNNGMGFRGDANWIYDNIDVQTPDNKPRYKPFDICPVWDDDGNLSGYVVRRPIWHEGADLRKLSADVAISHSNMENVQHIYLCELSTNNSGSLSADDLRWKVLDESQLNSYSVKNKWLLYDVADNGIISSDYRDAFVQTLLSGDATPDQTSIDWRIEDGELSAQKKLQIWHYKAPDSNDNIEVKGIFDWEIETSAEASAVVSCECANAYGLVVRPYNGSHVKYVQLSGVLSALSTDVDTSSISWVDRENLSEFQLSSMPPCGLLAEVWHYNELESIDKVDINTDSSAEPLTELSAYRLLARPEEGGTMKYMKLKIPDSSHVPLDLSSLDYISTQTEGEEPTVETSAQTWHYNNLQEGDMADVVDMAHDEGDSGADLSSCADQYRFLARPEFGGTMKYVQLSGVLSALSTDIDLSSLNWQANEGQFRGCDKVAQIWNWRQPTQQDEDTVLVTNAASDYKFLARPNNGSTLKYITLSADSGGGGEITLNGTDGTTETGDEFTFATKNNANVIVTVQNGEIQIGVYYV